MVRLSELSIPDPLGKQLEDVLVSESQVVHMGKEADLLVICIFGVKVSPSVLQEKLKSWVS